MPNNRVGGTKTLKINKRVGGYKFWKIIKHAAQLFGTMEYIKTFLPCSSLEVSGLISSRGSWWTFFSSFDRFSNSLAMAALIMGFSLFLSSFSWRWDILSIISLPLKKVVSESSFLILMIHSSGFVNLVLAKPWTTVIVSRCLTTNWSILSSLDSSSLMNLDSTSRLTQT